MNIMIVTNSAYLPHARLMLGSLFRHHPGIKINVFLPYEELTEQELTELSEFCGFFGEELYPLYVGDEFKRRVRSRNGIGVDTYYRILGIDLLPKDMERILYLDADMVIRKDLTELYRTDFKGTMFVVCEDIFGKINGFHEANKRRLSIPKEYSYFNAGVMLFNLTALHRESAAETMLSHIYRDFERYEYNDQDVMNELYYNQLTWAGWDEYNCPPAWYYLNKNASNRGELAFADYEEIRRAERDPEGFMREYINITRQIYDNAKIIHYLGDTKPWSMTRKKAAVYDIFDEAYYQEQAQVGYLPGS